MQRTERSHTSAAARWMWQITLCTLTTWLVATLPHDSDAKEDAVAQSSKHVIGATATITEGTSGLAFAARVDTGATTCSIHAVKWAIKDASKHPLENIGKPIRILIKNEKGDEAWIDAVVVGRVRVRSSVQNEDDYHGRYKVRLPLVWEGFKKDVLVTLNDRTDMDYPLLIGRNFLRGDFLVDVDRDNNDSDE